YYMIQNIVKHLVKENAAPQPEDFHWLFEQMQKWEKLHLPPAQIIELSDQCINLDCYNQAKLRNT
ncbi:nitrate transporter, partial [Acinetobacter seifertii]|nr:nitrate transporter [Acinetobacter seifertii]